MVVKSVAGPASRIFPLVGHGLHAAAWVPALRAGLYLVSLASVGRRPGKTYRKNAPERGQETPPSKYGRVATVSHTLGFDSDAGQIGTVA